MADWSPRRILFALDAAAAAQAFFYARKLPPVVASHFGASGRPDAWGSRDSFLLFQLGIVALVNLVFLGAGALLRVLPASLVNLPNRRYWLVPERREEAIADLQSRMTAMAVATVGLLLAVFELAARANLTPSRRLSSTFAVALLGAYLLFAGVWLVGLFRRYRRPPTDPSAPPA